MRGSSCFRPASWALAVVLAVGTPSPGWSEEPEFAGRSLSTWVVMAKEDPVSRKRRAALVALGQIAGRAKNDEETTRIVLVALGRALRNDAEPAVRRQAAGLIGQQPVDSAALLITDLTEAMRAEQDAGIRREVAAVLAGFGSFAKPAVTPLTDALADPDPAVRTAAANALGRIGLDARVAVPKLIELVGDPKEPARTAAVFALGRVQPEDTATAAAAILPVLAPDTDPELRREALQSLRFLGDRSDRVVRAVAAVLTDDDDADMRRQAVAILAKFGPAVTVVTDELGTAFRTDTDTVVRTTVIPPLSTAYAARTPELITLLAGRLVGDKADPDFEVRVAICEQLGSLGSKDALPILRDARRDSQIKVRQTATRAIRQIESPPEPDQP